VGEADAQVAAKLAWRGDAGFQQDRLQLASNAFASASSLAASARTSGERA